MGGRWNDEVPAEERGEASAPPPDGTSGTFVASDATNATVAPGTGVAAGRAASWVLVERETLPDGRAIRFFSWPPEVAEVSRAADTERAPIMIDTPSGGPPAPTRRAGGPGADDAVPGVAP